MKSIQYILAVCFIWFFWGPSYAAGADHNHDHHEKHSDGEHAHAEHKHHEHHVHGEAKLTLVIEDNILMMELHAPAQDVLGFEGKVTSPTQENAIQQAELYLSGTEQLFKFEGTHCQSKTVKINLANAKHISDVEAEYTFQCEQGQNLKSIGTSLFERFKGIQEIKVQWITESQQGASTLKSNRSTLQIGRG